MCILTEGPLGQLQRHKASGQYNENSTSGQAYTGLKDAGNVHLQVTGIPIPSALSFSWPNDTKQNKGSQT